MQSALRNTMDWMVWTALASGLLVASGVGLAAFGSSRWA
jgi:hypothetical protein